LEDLITRASVWGRVIPETSRHLLIRRLVERGSLAREGRRRGTRYTLTDRGRAHRRVLEIDLPLRLARCLVELTPEPQAVVPLVRRIVEADGVGRCATTNLLRRLEDLDLVTLSGPRHARRCALTELGAATLPDARAVLAFVEEVSDGQ